MPVLSGLIVSVDAFFIGLSLGLQKVCRFSYLVIINIFLFVLCVFGFLISERIYELIKFDTDLIVGSSFIALGCWCIFQYFRKERATANISKKTIVIVGLVMSIEAMLITMGITFIFSPNSNLLIPLTVALAHFGSRQLRFFWRVQNSQNGFPLF